MFGLKSDSSYGNKRIEVVMLDSVILDAWKENEALTGSGIPYQSSPHPSSGRPVPQGFWAPSALMSLLSSELPPA